MASDYQNLSREQLEEQLRASQASKASKRRRWPWLVLTLVVLLGGLTALAAGDWYLRNLEMDHLVTRVDASEVTMKTFLAAETDMATKYSKNPNPTDADKLAARNSMMAAAATGAAGVQVTGIAVGDVSVLPWHRGIKKAQKRYMAHSNTWLTYLTTLSNDYGEILKKHPQISGTFAAAKTAFNDAEPPFALHHLKSRVDDVFDD